MDHPRPGIEHHRAPLRLQLVGEIADHVDQDLPSGAPSRWLADWAHHLLPRASTCGGGRSLRQIERRMKAGTGQSHRTLAALGRVEAAFADTMKRLADDTQDWARLALAAGFAGASDRTGVLVLPPDRPVLLRRGGSGRRMREAAVARPRPGGHTRSLGPRRSKQQFGRVISRRRRRRACGCRAESFS